MLNVTVHYCEEMQMKIIHWLSKAKALFGGGKEIPDNVQIKKEKRDWRTKELKKASEKYGKPWKCGPVKHAREVFTGPPNQGHGTLVVVKANEEAEMPRLVATVSSLPKRKIK